LPSDSLGGLVEQADPAALLRAVDGLCADRDWPGLLRLRQLLRTPSSAASRCGP